ncbi:putative exonuclease [Trichodelitschia bisporula]|uniref:RNA exonuclease 4 n=1 Tax=Trichodelitschia bisporula TaxID=703511 RepID=A0A6G1HKS5_9PEZI|nr:putative exonuclease [Trichodelitschia bisporula]
MELATLSSNWKQLKKTLKVASPKPDSLKRKRSDAPSAPSKRTKPGKKMDSTVPGTAKKVTRQRAKSTNGPLNVVDSEEPERPATSHGTYPATPDAVENEGVSPTALAGRYIALDCEMVGVGPSPDKTSQVARVSLVNFHGHQLYDSYVQPQEPVTDYRTHITGITAQKLKQALPFDEVQSDVRTLLENRILIGHALKNDFEVLRLTHPRDDIRDTARYPKFRAMSAGRTPSLKKLAKEVLGLEIQTSVHSSVEDARACMLLFRQEKAGFEGQHNHRPKAGKGKSAGKKKKGKK